MFLPLETGQEVVSMYKLCMDETRRDKPLSHPRDKSNSSCFESRKPEHGHLNRCVHCIPTPLLGWKPGRKE